MLELYQKQIAVQMTAKYVQDETLSASIVKVSNNKEWFVQEMFILDGLAYVLNSTIEKQLGKSPDPDLEKITELAQLKDDAILPEFPKAFSWKDRGQRSSLTKVFKETIEIVNSEIQVGYHTPPKNVDLGNPENVFRFFMLDFYARYYVKLTSDNFPADKLEDDRKFFEHISLAMCEAAVVGAEEGNDEMKDLTVWLINHKWINKSDFNANFVNRASAISGLEVK